MLKLDAFRSVLRILFMLPSCALLVSCASVPELPWAPLARDSSAGFYDTARLEYRLDAGKLGQPLDVLCVDGRQIDYEQIASSPQPDRSIGTLVIQQPHPAGREGYARVTFSIDSFDPAPVSATSWNPLAEKSQVTIGHHEEVHETWAMDLPTSEANRYFELLSRENFHHASSMKDAAAELTVSMDGRQVSKSWEPLPELDALAQQVRSQGRLVAYLRPQSLTGEPTRAIASVKAYRELLAKTGDAAPVERLPSSVAEKPSPNAARER